MLRPQMLRSFKGLLRAQATAFKGDDIMQDNARLEIRSHFLQNSAVTDAEQLTAMIDAADQAADFLLTGVVQATANEETGGYDAKVESRHMKDGKTNVELHGIPDSIKDK